MKTKIKKSVTLLMLICILCMSITSPSRSAKAAMTYNNTMNANLFANVTSGGCLNATLNVMGINGKTNRIDVSLYVEKRILGLFWIKVNIGCDNNIWTDSTTNYYYSGSFSKNLTSTGTYRITVTYTVSGSGGPSDVITLTDTVSY